MGIDKETVGYVVISLDILGIFVLWISLQIHSIFEKLEEKEIEGAILDGADFTVEVENIPEHTNTYLLKAQIWRHIEDILKDDPEYVHLDPDDPNAHKIAHCTSALNQYSIMRYYKKRLRYEKQDRILALRQMILDETDFTEKEYNSLYETFVHKRADIKKRFDENEEIICKLRATEHVTSVKVYITMQSMEGKERIKKALGAPIIKRC